MDLHQSPVTEEDFHAVVRILADIACMDGTPDEKRVHAMVFPAPGPVAFPKSSNPSSRIPEWEPRNTRNTRKVRKLGAWLPASEG